MRIKNKIIKYIEYERMITSISVAASICNRETFLPLKNICKGMEIAVCGAGPSLTYYQPIDGVTHLALNRALLCEKVKFDYFFANDWLGINFFKDKIVEYDCKKYLGFQGGIDSIYEIPESFRIEAGAMKYYTDTYISPNQISSKLVVDIDKRPISNTYNMGLQVMQVALYMNPSRIYLVGIDASSNGHFTKGGLSEKNEDKYHDYLRKYIDIENVRDKWLELKQFRDTFYPETEIVSVNPIGLKGLFTDYYQDNNRN